MAISNYLRDLRAKIGNELIVVPAATGIVFDERDRMLLVRHSNGGVWVAPGGAVEPDETPADAVVREVWEETGLLVEPVRLAGVFGGAEHRVRYANGDEVAYVMTAFECRVLDGTLRPDGIEVLEARYVAAPELSQLTLSPWARILLPRFFERRGTTWFFSAGWRPGAS